LDSLALVVIDVTPAVDPDDLVILPLDEGSGTIAANTGGSGNDGTLVNGAAFELTSGDGSNSSVRFDGTNDYIDLGTLDVTGSGLTLACWLNADAFPGSSNDPRLISKASSTAGNDHVFMLSTINSGGVKLRGRIRIGGTTTTLIANSGNLATGTWHHAALTYDGATLRLYLDGTEVGSTALSGAVDTDATIPVAVGAQPPGAGPRFFDGLIDDVHILQRPMSAGEITTLASGGSSARIAEEISQSSIEDLTDEEFIVSQNFPNPFTYSTEIIFELPYPDDIVIQIYDIDGRTASEHLLMNLPKGRNSFYFDGKDQSNNYLPAGVYFYKISNSQKSIAKRMMILR
jgi:hypothetical protein